MSDTRLTLIGVALIFAGFLILGIFGSEFDAVTLESQEFGDCYEYSEDRPPVRTDCGSGLLEKALFFGLVVGFIAAGVVLLVRGAKGRWDQQVRPGDMVGPKNTDGGEAGDRSKD